jgi:hypothetical protein
MNKTFLLLTSAIVAAGLTSVPGFAADHHANKHQTTAARSKNNAHQRLNTNATVLNTNSFTGTVASGFTSIAELSVTAKQDSTLALSGMIQYCGFSGEFTTEATDVVALVDGSYVDNGPYQAPIRTDDICIADNWQGVYGVTAGTHTVEYDAYSLSGPVAVGRSTERVDVIKNKT